MVIFRNIQHIENHIKKLKKQGFKIGFVPTMGALHEGHISLIANSKARKNLTVCSIFVNPTQFNDKKDFDHYPITTAHDLEMLAAAGCDIVFLPTVAEMYPNGFTNPRPYNFGFLANTLEGEFRPGHFNGMAQVVERLLRIVKPHYLYMGLKDYQQQLIVAVLIQQRRLGTQLLALPTLREKDGLAMSSRNVRLNPTARQTAVQLSKTLKGLKTALKNPKLTIAQVQQRAFAQLAAVPGIEMEYLEIRNAHTLAVPGGKREKLVALVAAHIGGVRLIDNMLL